MKYKLALVMSVLCAFSAWTEAKVKLPAILSDGMVLQRERPVKIWGNADKGENVTVVFKKKKFSTVAGEDGKWLVELPPMKAGGPFEMTVNDIRLKDILVGDVWLCSGQSNMELTAGRVTDKFAEEIARDENPMIRYVKIPLGNDLHGPKDDLPGADWMPLTKETAPSFSALAYFFAKEMYRETQVPVGIVNSSWGGSSVEAWMSEEALQKFPRQLHERDLFDSDEYRELCNRSGQMMNRFWDTALYKGDRGLHDGICWNRPELDDTDWQTVDMFSKEWGRKNGYPVSGSHWFRQKVNVSAEQAGKEAVLRLGCMVDADSVFVNGIFVGNTFYQYPPRIYRVPASILKPGENQVTVRLINYGGGPAKAERQGLFSGLLFCADCGGKLHFATSKSFEGKQDHYVCNNYKSNRGTCTAHYIREDVLREIVLERIRAVNEYIRSDVDGFQEEWLQCRRTDQERSIRDDKKKLEQAKKRLADLDVIISRLYEDYVLGNLNQDRYRKMSADYEAEQERLKLEIEVIEEWVEQREEMNDGLDAFIALTQKYVDVEELTQTIVNEYIKKIVVYAPDKSSGKRKQKVKIFFNFVDDVDIPVISEPIVTQTTYERRKTA